MLMSTARIQEGKYLKARVDRASAKHVREETKRVVDACRGATLVSVLGAKALGLTVLRELPALSIPVKTVLILGLLATDFKESFNQTSFGDTLQMN